TILRCLNLARVGFTDCAQRVAVNDSRFHETDFSEKLHSLGMKQRRIDPDVSQRAFGKQSLIAEIVDREHRLDADERRIAGDGGAQVSSHHPGLPIMTMNHLWPEDPASYFDRGAR